MSRFTVTERRSLLRRLTPVSLFLIVLALVLGGLLLFAGGRWLLAQWPVWFPEEPPAVAVAPEGPTSTPVATAIPRPTATPVVTTTETFPATWAEDMFEDDTGVWWPADDDVRETLIATIQEHYLEGAAVMGDRPETEVLQTVTDEMARHYRTGPFLETWFTYRERYETTGEFNKVVGVVDDRMVLVYGFSEDGLSARVGETYMAAHLLEYDADTDTWIRTDIPEDGLLDGTQYLGVVVTRVQYDPEDGRWKTSEFEQWIPRPAP